MLLTSVRVPKTVVTVELGNIENILFDLFQLYASYKLYALWFQVIALLEILEIHESAKHRGHFALYNCFVLGHTKYKGVQRVYCNPFSGKTFHSSHRLDFVMMEEEHYET